MKFPCCLLKQGADVEVGRVGMCVQGIADKRGHLNGVGGFVGVCGRNVVLEQDRAQGAWQVWVKARGARLENSVYQRCHGAFRGWW